MKTQTQRDYEERILRVLVHIQQHLDHALDLDALAAVANFSPFHFHRVFRGMVGETVAQHVRRLRLERAAWQLRDSMAPITQVAFDAGYETHEAFTRAFRSLFDASPSEFREANRRVPVPAAATSVHYDPEGELCEFTSIGPEWLRGAPMEARIEKLELMRVAFVRHVGPYDQVGQAWQKLCAFAGRRGLFGPNTQMFGMCHDDPEVTAPENIRYDACIVVGDGIAAEGEIGIQEVPGGEFAVTTHHGPYVGLKDTYAQLYGQWIPAQGREPDLRPSLEFYRNDPNTTKPEDLVTDIFVALR